MLKFPCSLGIIESGRVSCKLELFHHRLCAALFSFEQERHVNFKFHELCCLILIASWSSLKKRLETFPRLGVVFLLKWNLCEIVLRLAEFRIQLGCFLEGGFGFIKLLLLHQNFATQIQSPRLIRLRLIPFVD